MNSLEINGVQYKKAAVAARELGYTADYVGQLCRAGKIDAKLVGRSWYVNPSSIHEHKDSRYRSTAKKTHEALHDAVEERRHVPSVPPKIPSERTPAATHFEYVYEPDASDLVPPVPEKSQPQVEQSRKNLDIKASNASSDKEESIASTRSVEMLTEIQDSAFAIDIYRSPEETPPPRQKKIAAAAHQGPSVRMQRPGTLAVRRLRRLDHDEAADLAAVPSPPTTRRRPIRTGLLLGLLCGGVIFCTGQFLTQTTEVTVLTEKTTYTFDQNRPAELWEKAKNMFKNIVISFNHEANVDGPYPSLTTLPKSIYTSEIARISARGCVAGSEITNQRVFL